MLWLIPAIVGLAAGLVGGLLGVGGSIIIIPAMVIYLSHAPTGYAGPTQHLLQAAAMICNVFVAAPSVLAHRRAGAIMPEVVVLLVPAAIGANLLGVAVSNSPWFARENGAYLAMILAGFLVYVAGYNAWRLAVQAGEKGTGISCRNGPPRAGEKGTGTFCRNGPSGASHKRCLSPFPVLLVGLLMGFVGGLLGIGGGAIGVPLQQVLLKIPLRRAIANSATTIVFSAALGAVVKNATLAEHGVAVADSLRLAAMLIPTAIVGSYLGGRLTHRLPRKALRAAFIVFMLVIACRLFYDAWHATGA